MKGRRERGGLRPTSPEESGSRDSHHLSVPSAALWATAAFVSPSLMEEAVFRAALLPHPKVDSWAGLGGQIPAGVGTFGGPRLTVSSQDLHLSSGLISPRPSTSVPQLLVLMGSVSPSLAMFIL